MGGAAKKKRQAAQNYTTVTDDKPPCVVYGLLWLTLVFLTAIFLWIGHGIYLSQLFENDRHFSHLADFEREMAYRTEMGLYYSYYKVIINAPSFMDGVYRIMNDNITEYGHTINTLQRFNLYPEIILSAAYRVFKQLVKTYDWKVETCWRVNRGVLPPIESCEGIGNAHYFYVNTVFAIAGSVPASVFLLGVILRFFFYIAKKFISGSYFGGLISAAAFVFNHGEATRVQWTPPLRESFAYPIFLAQICFLSYILKNKNCRLIPFLSFTFLTIISLLFWQFSVFSLATQLGSLFLTYSLEFISESTMKSLIKSYMISFLLSYALLFGNTMLLNSLFFSAILSILVIMLLRTIFLRISFRPLFLLLHFIFFALSLFGIRFMIVKALDIHDDDHVFDILRSKFTGFANFHTRLYTCAAEFDFISLEAVYKLVYTFLLPAAAVAMLLVAIYLLKYELNLCSTFLWRDNSSGHKPFAEIVYNTIQLACFCLMAVLIMRLKLFATPHLCVISSVLLNKSLLHLIFRRNLSWFVLSAFAVALISGMAYQGVKNVNQQLNIRGEYSNPDQEMLFEWIKSNTKEDAVFGGSMPVMANLKLSTERPIVNHPHYEHEEIRNRTLKVYSIYSKRPIEEVYKTLKSMGVDYYIFQPSSCQPNSRKGCSYREMWDLEDPQHVDRKNLCDTILDSLQNNLPSQLSPFKTVYNSRSYVVFKL